MISSHSKQSMPVAECPTIGSRGAMYLPVFEKFVYGVLSGEAFHSFGNEAVPPALKMPCLVVVNSDRLKDRLPDTSGGRDMDRSIRVRDWLKESYAVYAPVLRASGDDLKRLDLMGGAHTLEQLMLLGAQDVCIAVPVWQAAFFAETFN